MTWKELVPQRKSNVCEFDDRIDIGTENKSERRGYNQAITDHQPLYDYVEKIEQRVKELETVLKAWHEIFGTTQLTHASDRLNAAESKVERLERALEDINNVANNTIIKSITTDRIGEIAQKALGGEKAGRCPYCQGWGTIHGDSGHLVKCAECNSDGNIIAQEALNAEKGERCQYSECPEDCSHKNEVCDPPLDGDNPSAGGMSELRKKFERCDKFMRERGRVFKDNMYDIETMKRHEQFIKDWAELAHAIMEGMG